MNMRKRVIALALCGMVTLARPAVLNADPTVSGPITFEEVLTVALANSPLVKQVNAAIAGQLAEATLLRTLANPEISVGAVAPRSNTGEKNQYNVSIGQTLRLTNFGLRSTVASLIEQAGDTELKLALISLTQDIRLAYVSLWSAQQQEANLKTAATRAQEISKAVAHGRTKGLFGVGEEAIFQAQSERAGAELHDVRADKAKAEAEILRLTTVEIKGRVLEHPKGLISKDLALLIRDAEEGKLPIQKRIEVLQSLAQERASLARADAVPAFSPQIIYSRNEDGINFFGGGITFELPLTNRNQSERSQRESELRAARAQFAFMRSPLFAAQIALLAESVNASMAKSTAYSERVVPLLVKALDTYERQLREGQGTTIAVWQAQSELLAAQEVALRSWSEVFEAYTILTVLSGLNI